MEYNLHSKENFFEIEKENNKAKTTKVQKEKA